MSKEDQKAARDARAKAREDKKSGNPHVKANLSPQVLEQVLLTAIKTKNDMNRLRKAFEQAGLVEPVLAIESLISPMEQIHSHLCGCSSKHE
jgi:hypothetical protein